ncbi:MAG: hypothetical protein H6815_05090 [Phycisphaeraceae bacterium]|nr:hypothetical protein [Phycisphaerales bacterium]MCB9859811.1 hypothetical protein [Phycisphaeraceae bacterium]
MSSVLSLFHAYCAHAQFANGLTFHALTSTTLSPEHPSIAIRVTAYFDPQYFAFGGAGLDVAASDLKGVVGEPYLATPLGACALLVTGMQTMGGREQMGVGQLGLAGCFPYSTNPIDIMNFAYTIDDFTPRTIELTMPRNWGMSFFGDPGQFAPNVFISPENVGLDSITLTIVPAPSTGTLALGGLVLLSRRRR